MLYNSASERINEQRVNKDENKRKVCPYIQTVYISVWGCQVFYDISNVYFFHIFYLFLIVRYGAQK